MRFWKPKSPALADHPDSSELGPLEAEVMQIMWARGRSNVRDVVHGLSRALAYTTVMTTLDRLYKKGLLKREKEDRAFFYLPALSRDEWEQQRAGFWITGFLSGQNSPGELLVSCLVDAVSQHDEALLDELERRIALKRRELEDKAKA